MPHRVLIAGLFHETHTFLSGTTPLNQFQLRVGDELFATRGDGSPLAGIIEIGDAAGWEMIPAIDLRASPGPLLADEIVERFCQAVDETLDRELTAGIDAVCLVLHGAAVAESYPDVEGEIIRRLRARLGAAIPIGGVLDLHGNISREFAESTECFVAYRLNPHADACEAARDGARILAKILSTGEHTRTYWAQPALMWPPTGTGTSFEPMISLESLGRSLEQSVPGLIAINVFAGFSFADIAETGVSFTAIATATADESAIRGALQQLCDLAWQLRAVGNVREEPLDVVLDRVSTLLSARSAADAHQSGPIVLAEPSDNIGGGAPGDGTVILGALIDRGLTNSLVAVNDPEVVCQLWNAAAGSRHSIVLGGRGSPLSGGPIAIDVEMISHGPGRFQLEDRHSHLASMAGDAYDMGPCAVVRVCGRTAHQPLPNPTNEDPGIRVLLTTHKTPPFDLGQWRSQGLIPERASLIIAKAAVAHRKVYDPIQSEHFTVETPGPCSSYLASFPFTNVRRPIYPLDDIG